MHKYHCPQLLAVPNSWLSTTVPNSWSKSWLSPTPGKEFTRHEELAIRARLTIYFAHPYHSWERGTNENTNGLIRRLYPKGSSFAELDATELARIESYLNDRPRKCLGWRTPQEVFYGWIASRRIG